MDQDGNVPDLDAQNPAFRHMPTQIMGKGTDDKPNDSNFQLIESKLSPQDIYHVHQRLKRSAAKRSQLSYAFIDPTKFDAVAGTSSSPVPHLDKTVSPRRGDFLTMSHAAVTQDDGSTESITEFNGGVNVEFNERASMTMEVFVLNKNMSVFFSFIPKFYYILPWQIRLVP